MARIPILAILYRSVRDVITMRYLPQATPWGFVFAGNDAMAAGNFEPEETSLVRKLLGKVDIMVNLGANVGYYCCHALSMGKPVIAVEPNVRNLFFLLKNIEANGWSNNAEIFPVALGSANDILPMWGGGTGASLVKGWAAIPESYVTLVPVLNLDRVLGNKICNKRALILVDIEGSEFVMMQGANIALINEPCPIWMMEITSIENQPEGVPMNPNFAETFNLFFAHGYKAFSVSNEMTEITSEIVQEVVAGRIKLGTYNFIFYKP